MSETTSPTDPNDSQLASRLLIMLFLPCCWLGMQTVHECGHVAGGWIVGAQLKRVVLSPLEFSRTDFAANPQRHFTVWAGPALGVSVPLVLWCVLAQCQMHLAFLARFFADFCLIANGAYLGVGWTIRAGDAGAILLEGSPVWCLVAFGLVCVPAGLACWHGQGTHFGIGPAPQPIAWRTVIVVGVTLAATLSLNLLVTWLLPQYL